MNEKNYCVIATPKNAMERVEYLVKFKEFLFFYNSSESAHEAATKMAKRAKKLGIGVDFKVVYRNVERVEEKNNEKASV